MESVPCPTSVCPSLNGYADMALYLVNTLKANPKAQPREGPEGTVQGCLGSQTKHTVDSCMIPAHV